MYSSDSQTMNWQQQAEQYLFDGNYLQASRLYEAAIETEPDVKSHYWNLGLMMLLQGEEAEAQTAWLFAMAEGEPEEVEQWTIELIQVLQREAQRREYLEDWAVAWAIRQHIREIDPTDINNILNLIALSVLLKTYTGEELTSLGVFERLQSTSEAAEIDSQLLFVVLQTVLNYAPLDPQSLEFTKACLPYVSGQSELIDLLKTTATIISMTHHQAKLAVEYAELAFQLEPENTTVLFLITTLYQKAGNLDKGIELAKHCYDICEDLADKVYANHLILRGLMSAAGGSVAEVSSTLERHETLVNSFIELDPGELTQEVTMRLFSTLFFSAYLRDEPQVNNKLRQQVAQICQKNVETYAEDKVSQYKQKLASRQPIRNTDKPLRVGYISYCLRNHSVGWLARWLFHHHNREKFQVSAYLINAKGREDGLQDWYVNQVDKAHEFPAGCGEIADRISEDEIDILIDLDSITLDVTCEIMALKTAPVQVTWLGWDASEVQNIDYYIADPYVLPENAQDYYSEKIWRLPQTYIAVDGFEVGLPTLRRDELNIPSDAVIYLSSQRGFKYHPQTSKMQMQILKEVQNSYFLIKGLIKQDIVKEFFIQLAKEEGINPDRLIFLSGVPTSYIHRANLAIADVVLDTFPYNGATTTLETLWMEVPMVTRVGQQFASRNSYTMMVNAGINEGIAWTDEEYVEWGIRLGTDEALRQQVAWKLRKSKQTAPLWNGKQFTREMEKAYQQMWQIYLDSRG
ncbi:O-linked N-acetylglucosamine transferase, SPINDLY family protein [Limnoraphis robusta]|uniref:O-linked N-acetylglucosamine transferase, SPINDLY family protein n=1 Tax=Limnoraphis robusta CCNP1315 TaxID=3110306 RepID=A0ABU5TTD2_9CYAN|nr:O-linked N-acetylglucosamine transferase, SPINDLY family protein [Limnoraphis robusta]MEA5518141.1 O-linked N-acetylglucosamine transferase, SPINDLY family protein [Limnoraphis robusta CCNP1315]MEA5543415.1 O-linked N-acetylglucosamine transferase, SPINDLY family protein [Limnoraphis robusta CCNP1324]